MFEKSAIGSQDIKRLKTGNLRGICTESEKKKEKFMRVFANVPEKMRGEEVISVVDDKPFTWNAAMIEIKNDSELGKKILKILEKAGII